MMDVNKQFWLTQAQTIMNFGSFLRYPSEGKSIDKSFMYYSNKTFCVVLRGAAGRLVKSVINLLNIDATF